MRRAPLFAVLLAILALCACRPTAPRINNPDIVADASSAFVIVDALSAYSLSGDQLTAKETVRLGEKLTLTGAKASASLAGKRRDLLAVKRVSGVTEWVRADQVCPHAILAVLTATEAPLFTKPLDSAATGATLPRMTLFAIDIDTAGTSFLKITGYDTAAKMLLRDLYIRNEGTSSRLADVESVILLRLAAASQSPTQQKAFLDSGIKDYPDSVFIDDMMALRAALGAPATTAPTATAPTSGDTATPTAPTPTAPASP